MDRKGILALAGCLAALVCAFAAARSLPRGPALPGGSGGREPASAAVFAERGMADEVRTVSETLPDTWDFNHDGVPEAMERQETFYGDREEPDLFTLRVRDAHGRTLYEDEAGTAHVGQGSLYALRIDGQDYLMRYNPYMGQGCASYQYEIFSLGGAGETVTLRENSVEFDINFGWPQGHSYDVPAIAAFLREVHGYLGDARELLNTTEDILDLGAVDYSDTAALEQALRDFERARTQAQNTLLSGMRSR